ncbi:MAG: hypothetical protein AAF841_05825 [Pseudomonadota bacterium]
MRQHIIAALAVLSFLPSAALSQASECPSRATAQSGKVGIITSDGVLTMHRAVSDQLVEQYSMSQDLQTAYEKRELLQGYIPLAVINGSRNERLLLAATSLPDLTASEPWQADFVRETNGNDAASSQGKLMVLAIDDVKSFNFAGCDIAYQSVLVAQGDGKTVFQEQIIYFPALGISVLEAAFAGDEKLFAREVMGFKF